MEPSDLYNRNKRNLAVFSAILMLLVLVAIRPEDQQAQFAIRISNPKLVPLAIGLVNVYCLYQFWFAWVLQPQEPKQRIRNDFFLTSSLATTVIVIYAYIAARDIALASNATILVAVAICLAALLSILLLRRGDAQRWRRIALVLRRNTIRDRLTKPGWILNFNPTVAKGGTKIVEFLDDGKIGEGRNQNEHTWMLEGDELTIRRNDNALQNRFQYDEATDRFLSTGDKEAHAIKRGHKGQYIYRALPE